MIHKLKRGSTLGIICPSSNINSDFEIDKFTNLIQKYGFNYKIGKSVYAKHGYLAGVDEIRAKDLMDMFLDPVVDAILCYKGGYGCSRIVDKINYQVIKDNPKLLIGFSDITVLLNAIYQKTNIYTIHGQMGICLINPNIDEFTIKHFFQTLLGEEGNTISNYSISHQTIVEGVCEGEIVGGNLCLVTNLIGTPFDIDVTGKILLLEEVDEEPYAIDRMFAQLRLTNKLKNASGIILGQFTNCISTGNKIGSQTVDDLISEYFSTLKCPVIANFQTGHCNPFVSIYIGRKAQLDTTKGTITYLQ